MTKTCPHCHARVLSSSQPNLMGTTPELQKMYDEFGGEDWKDDPSADERWNAGVDFAMLALCGLMNVDPKMVSWDAATETVDGDVRAVIGNILRAKMGEDWSPRAALAATPAVGGEALDRAAFQLFCLDNNASRWPSVNQDHYRKEAKSILDAAQPASPLRGITDAMIEAGAKVHDPFAFDTDTSMPLHRSQSKDEARKEVRAILAAAFSASPPEHPAAVKMYKDLLATRDARIAELEDRLSKAAFNGIRA